MGKVAWQAYSLQGSAAGASALTDAAIEDQVETEWFSCPVDRKELKRLFKRSDAPGLRNFGLWFVLLLGSGVTAYFAWGTIWLIPAFALYGVLYSSADQRHHELSHGTAFKSRWINEALYHLCSLMMLREGFFYRWSHSRHHTHTIIVGRDPEIQAPRPPDIWGLLVLDLFQIKSGPILLGRIFHNATGTLTTAGRHFVPETQRANIVWASRLYVGVLVGVALACFSVGSVLPAMFIILPRFYGYPLYQLLNLTQHTGLAEDVRDHRLSTRTIYMNPVLRFLYIDMNYHLEHHMFPMVPFYRLSEVHDLIKDQCPPAYPSLWAALREMVPTMLHQRRNPSWYIVRRPPGADAPQEPIGAGVFAQ